MQHWSVSDRYQNAAIIDICKFDSTYFAMALYLLFGWTLSLEQSIRKKQESISILFQWGSNQETILI